ncbi:MAG: hypothetical protein WD850_01735, partial [Candidatus Spechtbacterales bacterium]
TPPPAPSGGSRAAAATDAYFSRGRAAMPRPQTGPSDDPRFQDSESGSSPPLENTSPGYSTISSGPPAPSRPSLKNRAATPIRKVQEGRQRRQAERAQQEERQRTAQRQSQEERRQARREEGKRLQDYVRTHEQAPLTPEEREILDEYGRDQIGGTN